MTNRVELSIAERFPFAAGHEFGAVGAYERLVGRAHFAVDPGAPAQRGVTDLDKAPLDAAGLVRFVADFSILKPVEPARGNRRVFFDYGNRGNKRMLQFFNDAPASNDPRTLAHAGNGFLMHRGYTVVWLPWQGDLLPGSGRMLLDLPVACEAGAPITGPVRVEYIANRPSITTFPLSGHISTRSHPTISLDPREASLTRRRYAEDERIPVPPESWCFARVEGGVGFDNQGIEQTIIPSDTHIHIPEGFERGWIYELVYTGRDPLVLGLGHVAVRDLVSFLRYADDGSAVVGSIEKAYAWGRSQTGRCLRDFVYRGFNADADGRKVFDGVLPHVAGAGRMWFNHRFANAVTSGGQQHEDHFSPADAFPFSYAETTDHLTGRRDAILKRSDTDPLVIHTQTATEYWQRRGSLVHTDTRGEDLPQPATVRVYLWASSQHFADPLLSWLDDRIRQDVLRMAAASAPLRGIQQNSFNTVATSALFRAMIDAMDRWATAGVPPPDSRIPRRADGSLVTFEEWRRQFPPIPGVAVPHEPNSLPLLDFGPDAERGLLQEPPQVVAGKAYPVLVPAVDSDGNDTAGVRAPMVAAPLGTYTGWNLRSRGFGHGAMHEFSGSYIPFPESPEERRMTGDPRQSVLERYRDAAAYVEAITAAARRLVEEGLMLEEDVVRAAAAAADWGRPRHDIRLK
jgi:Alpha/beta hydrolase domain